MKLSHFPRKQLQIKMTLSCVTCQIQNINIEETLRQATEDEDMEQDDHNLHGIVHRVLGRCLDVYQAQTVQTGIIQCLRLFRMQAWAPGSSGSRNVGKQPSPYPQRGFENKESILGPMKTKQSWKRAANQAVPSVEQIRNASSKFVASFTFTVCPHFL